MKAVLIALIKGLLVGLGLALALSAVVGLVLFDGNCGLNFLGAYKSTCSMMQFLTQSDGLPLFMMMFLVILWYIPFIITLVSVVIFIGVSRKRR